MFWRRVDRDAQVERSGRQQYLELTGGGAICRRSTRTIDRRLRRKIDQRIAVPLLQDERLKERMAVTVDIVTFAPSNEQASGWPERPRRRTTSAVAPAMVAVVQVTPFAFAVTDFSATPRLGTPGLNTGWLIG